MSPIKPTPAPGSLRAPDERTPAHGTRLPSIHLHKLPTDPGKRREMHDEAASAATTEAQRWHHTASWLGVVVEQGASTSRVVGSLADYMADMDGRMLAEFGKLSRQGSNHDLRDASLEARLVTAEQALAAAERAKATAVVQASTAVGALAVAEVRTEKAQATAGRAKAAALAAGPLGALIIEGILWLLRHS